MVENTFKQEAIKQSQNYFQDDKVIKSAQKIVDTIKSGEKLDDNEKIASVILDVSKLQEECKS